MTDKLIINILGKEKTSDKKTAVFPSKKPRRFGRRRTGGIRFWDLGYVLNGDQYVNLPFVDPHSGEPILTSALEYPLFDTLTSAYYSQLATLVQEVPVAEWKANYKRVDSVYTDVEPLIMIYRGVTYNTDSTSAWDGETFRPNEPPTDDAFFLFSNRKFEVFNLNSVGTTFKATTEPDYSADTATFVPSANMDVFLMPNLHNISLNLRHTNIGVGTQTRDYLNVLRYIYPRDEVLHDPTHPIYGFTLDSVRWTRSFPDEDDLEEYEVVHPITRFWQSVDNARALRAVVVAEVPTFSALSVNAYADAGKYPDPPSMPGDADTIEMGYSRSANFALAGSLVAVIKKGGVYYYVWQTA